MADRPQIFLRDIETCGVIHGVPSYRKSEADTLFERLETNLRDTKALHASIIDQGRKVLNATSDKGLSHADFIEWALERLEGK